METQPIFLAIAPLVPHRDPISAAQARSLMDAAAAGGFSGIEWWIKHHDSAVADGMSSDEFFDYARQLGLSMVAAEFSDTWATADRHVVEEANAHLIEVSARSGTKLINAVARQLPSFDEAATGLGHLCDLAGEHGLAIALEMVPFGGATDIATIARFLEAVDRDNLGFCLDAWHWFRQPGGIDISILRSIPGERVYVFQLDDATAQPTDDLIVETMTARLLPGEGVADIMELLDTLDDIGASPVVVSEVYSRPLAALDPTENARRQHDAIRQTLERHQASKAS